MALTGIAERFASAVRDVLYPELNKFALGRDDGATVRTDANENDATLARLRIMASRAIDSTLLKRTTLTVAERVEHHAGQEFKRLGIKVRDIAPHFGGLIDVWRSKNVSLVQSLAGKELTRLESILAAGENLRVEELRDQIEQAFEVTRSKANFIARDQTLKLNGQIVQQKQVAAGIEEYVWTTSGDERVREDHAALDGTTQRWDDPPVVDEADGRTANPGEDYQCRCIPFAILPELEENADETPSDDKASPATDEPALEENE